MHGALDSSIETRTSGSLPLRDFDADGAAFGDFLRTARERRGLTLQQISSETKIPWRHLDALEHGRLNAVPGGTYRRGEIRAYAEVVGLDKNLALARLDRALEAAAPQAVPKPPSAWRSIDATVVRRWSVLVLAVAIAGAIAMMNTWGRAPSRTIVPRETAAARNAARASAPPPPANAVNALPPADVAPPAPAVAPVATPSTPVARAADVSPSVKGQAPNAPANVPLAAVSAVTEPAQPATPAAPPTPAVPREEGLVITSDPPGARVTIDGVAWGVTPVTIQHLPPGEKRIRLTKPSLPAAERTVRISADHPGAAVHIVLQP